MIVVGFKKKIIKRTTKTENHHQNGKLSVHLTYIQTASSEIDWSAKMKIRKKITWNKLY